MSKRLAKATEVAKATMLGDLRDICLDIFKHPNIKGKAWKDMSESEQREVASMIENKVKTSITRSIDIIASEGRKHVKVMLKQVTVKDGLKGSFECAKSHELRHDLIDAQGDYVLVVMTSSEKYLGEKGKVKFDKDQPELIKEKEANEEKHDPKTGEIIEDDEDEAEIDDTEEDDDGEETDEDDFDEDDDA